MNNEKDIALMESNRIAAVDMYFEARPNLDSAEARRIFESAFQRGWDAKANSDRPFAVAGGGGGDFGLATSRGVREP